MRKLASAAIILALSCQLARADNPKPAQVVFSLAYAGLAVADTALTVYGTGKLGLVETNRIMRPFFERRQYVAAWAISMAAMAAFVAACHFVIHTKDKTARVIGYALLAGGVAFRGYVVWHNARLHGQVR